MLIKEPATEEQRRQFLDAVIRDESPKDKRIIAEYYASQDMPIEGIYKWFCRSWQRYLDGDRSLINRLTTPAKPRKIHSDINIDRPDYLGPNGTWSLD